MKIHEYQAKAILSRFGIPVPQGRVARTPAKVRQIATRLGGRVAIKAQVYAGGRGKAGGIRVADSPDEAEKLARQILGRRLVTHQTSAEGVPVSKVLVEEVVDIQKELYLGVVVDERSQLPVMMGSPDHVALRLRKWRLTTRQTVLASYAATGFLGAAAITMTLLPIRGAWIVLGAVLVSGLVLAGWLRRIDMSL